MASFRKRGEFWYYRIKCGVNPKTGKPMEVQRGGFRTKREAQLAAAEQQTALSSGSFVAVSSITFQQFATEWLASYALNVKKSSVRIRQHQLALLYEVLGKIPLQSINPRIYQKVLDSLANFQAYPYFPAGRSRRRPA